MNKVDLYERSKALYREIVTLEEDLEALAEEFTYVKDENDGGIDKKEVKATLKAAEVYVRNNVDKIEDKIQKDKEFLESYRELSGEY
ncbi:hypothetical protein D3C85_1027310 [compost metagenome]